MLERAQTEEAAAGDETTAARAENHEGHSQIDQARFPDIRRNEFGRRLDGSQEQRQVARRCWAETELVVEHMPGAQSHEQFRAYEGRQGTSAHRVRVMISVLGSSSAGAAIAWTMRG